MTYRRGITILEILVVLVILIVAASLILPMLRTGHPDHRPLQNSAQVLGIHTALTLYAQSNKDFYPGRKSDGSIADSADVATRLYTLIQQNYFTTEFAISPYENPPPSYYSYDIPSLADTTGRRFDGWRITNNGQTPVVTDRLAAGTPGQPATYRSVHTTSPGDWQGSVAYNDGHVDYVTKAVLSSNDGKNNHPHDDLFSAESADDTMMVYSGT